MAREPAKDTYESAKGGCESASEVRDSARKAHHSASRHVTQQEGLTTLQKRLVNPQEML